MTTATPDAGDQTTFADLGLEKDLVQALTDQGIIHPFPIQELTLGLALQGADIIGQARTGTGKTLGFGLPMLQRLGAGDHVQVLVIVPTRELCVQVTEDLQKAGARKDINVLAVYGGKALDPQIDALRAGDVQVVVGTPGRLLDLLRRGDLRLSGVQGLVLDEADEMLDLGFLPDVEQLIEACGTARQTLLFSATMPAAVVALARRYMDRPTFLRADVEEVHIGPKTVQHFFSCHRMDKPAVLARILQDPERGLCVVFCRTKRMCDILAEELRDRGIDAAPIHSDLRQESREKALNRFREGKTDVLVATEVAARGLDIDHVTHVVNYDCPDDEKMYLHRVGRTGRAGAAGVAITLAVWNELARLKMIKKALDITAETHEVYSTSPIIDELFDLPPREERPRSEPRKERSGESRSKGGKRSSGAEGAPKGRRSKGRERTETADPSPAPRRGTRADADADAEAEPRIRRRRRGGRGRGTSGDEQTTEQPAARAKADAPQDDQPATEDGATRVRQRTRGRDGDAATGGATEVDESPSPGADDGGDDDATRTRTRTRTRSTGERRNGERSGAERADRSSAAAEPAAAEPAAAAQTKGEGRSQDRKGGGSRSDSSRGSGGGGRGSRSGSGSRSGGRGSGSGSRSGGGRQQQPKAVEVSSEEARGDGRPRLRRPLEVAHLP